MDKLPVKKFQRCIEDFQCHNCGHQMKGNGYTNHCSKCLYSKHVDINPGDREAQCGGLMKPIDYFFKNGNYIIIHECQTCKLVRNNKATPNDDFSIFMIQ